MNEVSLDQKDIKIILGGVRIVRDCGLLDEELDKHAWALLKKLKKHEAEEAPECPNTADRS